MANKYFGFGGNNTTGDGSVQNPYLDYDTAVANSLAGDKVIAVDGDSFAPTSHFVFDDNRIVSSLNFRGATLKPAASETTRTARTSGNLSAVNNPWRIENLIIDGLGQTTQSFELAQDATEDLILQLHNLWVKPGSTYNLFINNRRGRLEIVNMKLTGGKKAIASTASLAGDGNQVIDINGLDVSLDYSSDTFAMQLSKVNNLTNSLSIAVKGLTGNINAQSGVTVYALDIKGCDSPLVTGFDLTITGDNVGQVTGILCRGESIATASNVTISNGTLNFLASSGYGIAFGQSSTDSFVTGGTVTGVTVKGKYFASSTPHNVVMGQGTNGTATGIISTDGFVGILISKTIDCNVDGNLLIDCYGPSIYIKGATNSSIKNNVCVLTGKYAQRSNGVISVVDQIGVNTAASTISGNLVIISDINKIHSLAQIAPLQTCLFSNNTYIVPDSVDLNTELLFSSKATGNPPDLTYAQWLSRSDVSNDIIIQMPQSEVDSLASKYAAQGSSSNNSGLFLEIAPGINIGL